VLSITGGVDSERPLPAKGRCEEAVLRRRDRAGDEQAEVDEVSAVQGNLLDCALAYDRADRCGRGLDDGRIGGDGNLLCDAADGELEVLHDRARDLKTERGYDLRLEALRLNLYAVDARLQGGHL